MKQIFMQCTIDYMSIIDKRFLEELDKIGQPSKKLLENGGDPIQYYVFSIEQ
tara:strand:+ start:58 stop:213 length:156 start_codon:yes stop_codon:yes gene_type:complete